MCVNRFSFWIAKSSKSFTSRESFDHLKDGYLRDSWEDVFSTCDGSVEKLLTDHLLRDDSRLGEDVSGQ